MSANTQNTISGGYSVVTADTTSLVIDIKAQIWTLLAKLTLLREAGSFPEDIDYMIQALSTRTAKNAGQPTDDGTKPPRKLLLKVETVRAHSEHVGPNWRHMLVRPGDVIDIYAYLDEKTAIGFNTCTNLGGQFPVAIAAAVPIQNTDPVEVLWCNVAGQHGSDLPTSLRYETGQYVRVCKRDAAAGYAYGINHETLAMGKFDTRYHFTKVKWAEEEKPLTEKTIVF